MVLSTSIQLRPATLSDLPQIVALQFACFSQDVLIEKIVNPNTPENRETTFTRHRMHMLEDPGCKVVVAVTSSTGYGDVTSGKDKKGHGEEETIVAFCMFYYPTVSKGGEVMLPIPLRPPPSQSFSTPASAKTQMTTTTTTTTTATSIATVPPPISQRALSDPDPKPGPISISQTNIPSLLPYRRTLVEKLLSTSPAGAGYIRYMSVSSSYRRAGIGRALMDWGISRYDEDDVPVYLEATADGEKLYTNYGFEKVGEQVLEVYGSDGVEVIQEERCACMWRKAKQG